MTADNDPIAERRARIEGATAFLKRRCILVSVVNREAQIRTYRVSGKRDPMLLDEVVAFAMERGFEPRSALAVLGDDRG